MGSSQPISALMGVVGLILEYTAVGLLQYGTGLGLCWIWGASDGDSSRGLLNSGLSTASGHSEMANPTRINQLPLQVITRIFTFLNYKQRKTVAPTCKAFDKAACDPQFASSTEIKVGRYGVPDKGKMVRLKRIPNMRVEFHDNDAVVPRLAKHFASTVKSLSMTGEFSAKTVVLVRRHFKKLKTLQLELESLTSLEKFFGDTVDIVEEFRDTMGGFPNVIFRVPSQFQGLLVLVAVKCLSGVKKLSITSECVPREEDVDKLPFLNGNLLVAHLTRSPALGQCLQELNLTWVATSHKELKSVLSKVNPNLRSLAFLSSDGGGSNLLNLAETDLKSLESLMVVCQRQERFDVRFPAISTLLASKPSLKSFSCNPIVYPAVDDGCHPLVDILNDWPGIHDLEIKGRKEGDESKETEMVYTVKNGVCRLAIKTSACLDNHGMLKLAETSQSLKEYAVHPCVSAIDATGLGMLANTFPDLHQLLLGHYKEKSNIHVGILSPKLGGSRLANLQVLSLAYCQFKTIDDLMGLSFPNLKQLWVPDIFDSACHLSDEAISAITHNNPTLEMLDIGWCKGITDTGIASIADNLKHLKCLLVPNCVGIMAKSARVIARNCHWLEYINVTGCHGKFVTAMKRNVKSMPHMQRILFSHHWADLSYTVKEDPWGDSVRYLLPVAALQEKKWMASSMDCTLS